MKRAESAKKYIQDKYNIPGDGIVINYGDSKPIADDKTQEGRARQKGRVREWRAVQIQSLVECGG